MILCDKCGKEITGKSIVLSDDMMKGTYCTSCCNQIVSELMGLSFEQVSFEPLQAKDSHGKRRTFYFETVLGPAGVVIEAYERLEGDEEGYKFSVIDDLDCDLRELHSRLIRKARRGLRHRHLERNDWDRSFGLTDIVRGRISCSGDSSGPVLVVDGKSISWDEFGRMLVAYEGFQFRLQFVDPTEEVR